MVKSIRKILISKYTLFIHFCTNNHNNIVFYFFENKSIILDKFSNELFQYPLPSETVILEKHKFDGKNWVDGGGNGGYWNVVAIMKLSTGLSRSEILKYYKKAKFTYPKSDELGVDIEIYFEDDLKKEEYEEGYYYRRQDGAIGGVYSYSYVNGVAANLDSEDNHGGKLSFIIQIISGYDYFLNLD